MTDPTRPLDAATVEQIARLARLSLSADEIEHLARDLAGILAYVEQLDEVDTEGVEPTAAAESGVLVRRDGLRLEIARGDCVREAAEHTASAFRVPRVLG